MELQWEWERLKPNSSRRSSTGKISLGDYLGFLRSGKQLDLTINHLNQILTMHGFCKINGPKKVLIEAVKQLDLIDLCRSTARKDDVCPEPAVELEEVIADLNNLNWKECCVTSIRALNSSKKKMSSNEEEPSNQKLKNECEVMEKSKALVESNGDGIDRTSPSSFGSVLGEKQATKKKKNKALKRKRNQLQMAI